ncbi:hypothetical protein KMZ27_06050 [Pseudomonas shirazica]|nr:hypothetical protein [Pseudomonas shirazica]
MLEQCARHVHHVHQGKGQFALAAVLVGSSFLRGGGGAAQQGDGVFLGLVAGYTLVQGPDPVVQGGTRRVGVEVVVEGAAGGFAVEICFVVFRGFILIPANTSGERAQVDTNT